MNNIIIIEDSNSGMGKTISNTLGNEVVIINSGLETRQSIRTIVPKIAEMIDYKPNRLLNRKERRQATAKAKHSTRRMNGLHHK